MKPKALGTYWDIFYPNGIIARCVIKSIFGEDDINLASLDMTKEDLNSIFKIELERYETIQITKEASRKQLIIQVGNLKKSTDPKFPNIIMTKRSFVVDIPSLQVYNTEFY